MDRVYETYAVMAIREDGKTFTDKVCAYSELDARKAFKEIYRHGEFKILAVVKI